MKVIVSLFLMGVGFFMTFFPEGWFTVTESWKSYSASEPSVRYVRITRIWGIICILGGIAYILVLLI